MTCVKQQLGRQVAGSAAEARKTLHDDGLQLSCHRLSEHKGLAVLANGNASASVADLVLVAILRLPGKCL